MSDVQLKIRLPAELKEQLEFWAAANNRSLTAELVHRLTLTFPASIDEELVEIKNRELDLLRARMKVAKDHVTQLKSALKTAPVGEVMDISAHLAAAHALAEELEFRYESELAMRAENELKRQSR